MDGKGRSIQIRTGKHFEWAVFDTESYGLNARAFRFGCLRIGDTRHVFRTQQEFWDLLLTMPECTLYAHHIEYDLSCVCPDNPLFELEDVCLVGSRFISGRWKHITFCDSHNHLSDLHKGGGRLQAIAERLGSSKLDMPRCLDDRFPEPTHSEPCAEEIAYCWQDVDLLHAALTQYFAFLSNQGIKPRALTLAQNSLAIWLENYLPPELVLQTCRTKTLWVSDLDACFRDAYYGGRAEVLSRAPQENVTAWDVCAMYPSVMAEGRFPHPGRLQWKHKPTDSEFKRLLDDTEGMVTGIARVPPGSFLGPLPVRLSDTRTIWPAGRFHGSWCFPEVRALIERGGTFEPQEVVFSQEVCTPFVRFVERFFEMRLRARDEFEREQVKLIMNALYGKLGQCSIAERVYQREWAKIKRKGEWTWHAFRPSALQGPGYWQRTPPDEDAYHSVLSWASYVTSYARVRHLQGLERSNAVYGDTDSAWSANIVADNVSTEERLGVWRAEVRARRAQFFNVKTYEYETESGEVVRRCKGLPKKYLDSLFNNRTDTVRRMEVRRLSRMLEGAAMKVHPCTPITDVRPIMMEDRRRLWHSDSESQPHILSCSKQENKHVCC